ncbi:MAG: protease modulator HflC [Candidatus Electryonea clarkiae]|nr:protease modulator HflC [Candidatus Electryonea clarkiae]MDP8285567.1 protease modulator HflC [Candidatus Electryonea clarkiae]
MNRSKPFTNIIIAIVAIIAINLIIYTVNETDQVIVLQFGKPLRTVTDAGIHFKLPPPFNTIERFEKRLLIYDSPPNIVVTEDKKNMVVDSYARWRITDPLLFRQTVRTESSAQARLDDIIYSDLLQELGQSTLDEIVGVNRDSIMIIVTKGADIKAKDFGIEILDVRIKRTDLPEENEEAIYRRMRAERSRIANLYRSEGEEEALKIRAEADRAIKVILANAYKEAKILRGDAEADAISIYAKAFNRDPSFYEFSRSLEMYKKAVDENTTIVLPPGTNVFKYLK